MSKQPIKDLAASIRQRLQDFARASARPFQEVLQYFAMERFLYRVSQSSHADKFILKGALMLAAWRAPSSRPTKDLDFLGRIENDIGIIAAILREV